MALPNLLAGSNPHTLGDALRRATPDVADEFYRILYEPVEGVYPMSVLFLDWEGGGSIDDVKRRIWDRLARTTVAHFIYFANSSDVLKHALSKLSRTAQDQLSIVVPAQLVPLQVPVNPPLRIQSGIHGKVSLRDAVQALDEGGRLIFVTAMTTPAHELAAALNDRKRAKRWRGDLTVTYTEVMDLLDNNHGTTVEYFIETLNLKPENYPGLIRAITTLPQNVREAIGFWVTEVPHPLPTIRARNRFTQTDMGATLQANNHDMNEFYLIMSTPIDGTSPETLVWWYQWSRIPTDKSLQETRTGSSPWSHYNYLDLRQFVTMANKNPILWRALAAMSESVLQRLGIIVPPEARQPVVPTRPVSPLLLPPAVAVGPTIAAPPPTVQPTTLVVPPPTITGRQTVVVPPPPILRPPTTVVVPPPPILRAPTTVVVPPPPILRPPTTVVVPLQ